MSQSVSVNHKLCSGVFPCGRCIEACAGNVLMARPGPMINDRERSWRVVVALLHRCDGCRECVAVCPTGAISLQKA